MEKLFIVGDGTLFQRHESHDRPVCEAIVTDRRRDGVLGPAEGRPEMSDTGEYLVVVDYEDERERKRAEYLLDNWEDGTIESLDGMSRVVRGVDIDELYDQLAAKVPEDELSAYELNRVDTEATQVQATIDETFDDVEADRVEWAMESIMKKRKAVDQGSTAEGESLWAVYTKKGRAEIRYDIRQQEQSTIRLHIVIDGFGDAPEFLREFIQEEIGYMIA
ncbi:Uncharacterized protein LC1Hm_4043 (plasmid) [Halomicrobium sp. LC1Hm]|nr:Uncharacterized protein LC1Hm_4043 [Halomicrobium sp. LC1Hm]